MLRRLAMEMCAIGVRYDQAGVGWEDLARHLNRRGEEQPVAVQPVVLPFLVGAKVGDRRFDLDDPEFAGRKSSATKSARRPEGSGSSLTTQKPCACSKRAAPRATASAVSDWRPSMGTCSGCGDASDIS